MVEHVLRTMSITRAAAVLAGFAAAALAGLLLADSGPAAADADVVFEVDNALDNGVEPNKYDCTVPDDPDIACTLPAAFEQIGEVAATPLDSVEIVIALDQAAAISLGTHTHTLATDHGGPLTIRGESPDGSRQVVEGSGAGGRIIEAADASRITLEGMELTGGVTTGDGGAVVAGGDVDLVDSALVDNTAERGGAVWTAEADVAIIGSELRGNHANVAGGAVWVDRGDVDVAAGSVLDGNHADERGGAIHVGGGTATIADSVLAANSTEDVHPTPGQDTKGGAVHAEEGTDQGGNPIPGRVIVTASELTDNASGVGGAIHADGATIEDGSRLADNTAADTGGAVLAGADALTVEEATLAGNTAAGSGGALRVPIDADGQVTITRSTLTGNAAGSLGGALFGGAAPVTVTTSTISGNASTGSGGGIAVGTASSDPDPPVELVAVTLYDNLAGGDGHQLSTARADTTIERSVLWGPGESICRVVVTGSIDSHGHNFVGDDSCDLDAVTDVLGDAPLLGPLADQGGATRVHLPSEDSPLVAAGGDACAGEADQRGLDRPQGEACDIGAVEREPGEVAALRLAGADRVETAAAIARHTFPDGADTAVLATGDDPADSLGAAPLASAVDGPLLLNRGASLRAEVATALDELGVDEVLLIGGSAAIPGGVEDDLTAQGWNVDRVFGADRYATAAAVADEIADRVGPRNHALVAASDPGDPSVGWPDALAAGSYAGIDDVPILLTATNALPDATAGAMGGIATVEIVGGSAVVSTAVEGDIGALASDVSRLSGANRWETAVEVADAALAAGVDAEPTWVATGWNWPDGLSAGAAATAEEGVLVLVDGNDLDGSAATRDWIAAQSPSQMRVAGGSAAVSDPVLNALEALMD